MTKHCITVNLFDLPDAMIEYEGERYNVGLLELMRAGNIYLKTDSGKMVAIKSFSQGFNILQKKSDGTVNLLVQRYSFESQLLPVELDDLIEIERMKSARDEYTAATGRLITPNEDVNIYSAEIGYELVYDDEE